MKRMDNITSSKIYYTSNHLEIVIGTLFSVNLLYITFIAFLILHYKILHTRINWILFNWFITVIICLLFNAITFFTPNPLFNIFLYYYCHVTVDLVISNVYFMFMLSFDTVIVSISDRSFKLIMLLVWIVAILQYCLNIFINIRYLQISLCQIPLFIIIVKYLFSICDVRGKGVNYSKQIRFISIGNYLLVYLGGFIIHSIYYAELPNENNYFQLFYYNVFIICPIYISACLLVIDKNFRKCFLHSTKCRNDSITGIELSEIAILETSN